MNHKTYLGLNQKKIKKYKYKINKNLFIFKEKEIMRHNMYQENKFKFKNKPIQATKNKILYKNFSQKVQNLN